jgi:hypothetical protein
MRHTRLKNSESTFVCSLEADLAHVNLTAAACILNFFTVVINSVMQKASTFVKASAK